MNSIENLVESKYPAQLQFKGLQAGGVSWNGIEIDICKSGIQKYIRRGNFEKAIWCAFELDLMHEMYERVPEKATGLKALSTNIIHRLLIISIEDIGIGNPALPLLVDSLVKMYKNDRFNLSLRDRRRGYIYTLVRALNGGKKSRELSHIRSVYSQVFGFDGQEYIGQDGLKHKFLMSDLITKYPEVYTFDRTDGEDELSRDNSRISSFHKEYLKGSDACFYWFFLLFNSGGTSKAACRQKVMPLLTFILGDTYTKGASPILKVMNILVSWFKEYDFDEYVLFAMQVVLLGLRKPTMSNIHEMEQVVIVPKDEWESLYLKNVQGPAIEIDDFVLDKHTKSGKKQGKGLALFATEGSVVVNEYEGTNQIYKEIYTTFRQYDFGKKMKSASLDDTSQCEAIYSSGSRRGFQCTNKGKVCVADSNGKNHWYCGIHASKVQTVPVAHVGTTSPSSIPAPVITTPVLQCVVTHTLTKEQIDTLFSPSTPRGQLLCGKHKKQVLIPREGEFKGLVIKGPWRANEIEKLNKMLFRMRVMNLLNVKCVPFSVVNGEDGNGYTFYRNLSPFDPSQWRVDAVRDNNIAVQVVDMNGTVSLSYGMDILRIDRGSMGVVQMSNLQPQEQRELLFGDQFVFSGLVVLALMQVGDVGLFNILVVNRIAHIVDYEESTTRVAFTSLGNFLKQSVEKYVTMFFNGIRDNKEKITTMITRIEESLPKIKQLASKHGVVTNFDNEWSNIKSVLQTAMV